MRVRIIVLTMCARTCVEKWRVGNYQNSRCQKKIILSYILFINTIMIKIYNARQRLGSTTVCVDVESKILFLYLYF